MTPCAHCQRIAKLEKKLDKIMHYQAAAAECMKLLSEQKANIKKTTDLMYKKIVKVKR